MARVFLAIDLPLTLKKELFTLKRDESLPFARLKWVEEENLHLTLFFFGDLRLKEIESLTKICLKRTGEYGPMEIFLTQISGFPSGREWRVVFFTCEERSSQLIKLVKQLSGDFKKKGFKFEERDFHPHITLFRLKGLAEAGAYQTFLVDLVKEGERLKGRAFLVKELTLFESKLGPGGPKYLPLKTFPLGGR